MAEAQSAVVVRSLAGNNVAEVSPAPENVGLLKAELEGQLGVPAALQRLLRGTAVLGDEESLCSSSIHEITFVVDESPLFTWDIAGNPNSGLLSGAGSEVVFANEEKDFVNVVALEPVRGGVHFFEFVMHHVGDEQWCGVCPSKARAGYHGEQAGFFYYSGRRSSSFGELHAPAERRIIKTMKKVSSGDVIGMLVDIERGALVFTLNGTVQDGCRIPKEPMYATTSLDTTEDRVELRRASAADAPEGAQKCLDVLIESEEPVPNGTGRVWRSYQAYQGMGFMAEHDSDDGDDENIGAEDDDEL